MTAIVVQSAPPEPPAWLGRCMDSVQAWARQQELVYRAAGDVLFDHVPAWLRVKTRDRPQVATDVARLRWIRELLDEGWSAVIWLDADVLVLDPAALGGALDLERGYLLGRETWIAPDARGRLREKRGVHNALCAFARDNPFLAFYLDAAERVLWRHEGPMVPQLVGPKLLTALDNLAGLPATDAVDMASPRVLADAAHGGGPALEQLVRARASAPAALNLCHSYAGRQSDGVTVDARLLDDAIDGLINGELLAPADPAS